MYTADFAVKPSEARQKQIALTNAVTLEKKSERIFGGKVIRSPTAAPPGLLLVPCGFAMISEERFWKEETVRCRCVAYRCTDVAVHQFPRVAPCPHPPPILSDVLGEHIASCDGSDASSLLQ